jgi:hypothetical protein
MRQILSHHKISLADTSKAHEDRLLSLGGASGRFMLAARALEERGALNYNTAREIAREFYPSLGWPATAVRRMVALGALKVEWTRKPRVAAGPIEESELCVTCRSRRRDVPFSECSRCCGNRMIRLGLIAKRRA